MIARLREALARRRFVLALDGLSARSRWGVYDRHRSRFAPFGDQYAALWGLGKSRHGAAESILWEPRSRAEVEIYRADGSDS